MKLDQIRDTGSEACICGTDLGHTERLFGGFWKIKSSKKNVETYPDLTNSEGGLMAVKEMMMVAHTDRGC